MGARRFVYTASSFATDKDLAAFRRAKELGLSDKEAFALGDNGIGQWGAVTCQTHTAMVALHADDLIARWGSVNAARGKAVLLIPGDGTPIRAIVEDRCGVPGRIDLNPACLMALGWPDEVLRPLEWEWEDQS